MVCPRASPPCSPLPRKGEGPRGEAHPPDLRRPSSLPTSRVSRRGPNRPRVFSPAVARKRAWQLPRLWKARERPSTPPLFRLRERGARRREGWGNTDPSNGNHRRRVSGSCCLPPVRTTAGSRSDADRARALSFARVRERCPAAPRRSTADGPCSSFPARPSASALDRRPARPAGRGTLPAAHRSGRRPASRSAMTSRRWRTRPAPVRCAATGEASVIGGERANHSPPGLRRPGARDTTPVSARTRTGAPA